MCMLQPATPTAPCGGPGNRGMALGDELIDVQCCVPHPAVRQPPAMPSQLDCRAV